MDFMKVFDQTVREIKREVNLKVLKVPEIEQKALDATDDEPWGPHGTALAEIAQATKKFTDCQIIMNVIWTRLTEMGKNWRFVYKALAVIEYLVAHGSERAVDDIIEHTYQISSLSTFEYVEPNGKDLGINVRKKSETIVALLNDKDKMQEVRNKAATNREKYIGLSSSGITYKSGAPSFSSSNFKSNDRYGGFGNRGESETSKTSNDSYRDKDYYGEGKYEKTTRKKKPSRSGRKEQDSTASVASNKSTKSSKSDKYASGPSQTAQSNKYDDDFDDFDPRGTSSSKPSAVNNQVQVDLFGENFVDLLDAPPASVPTDKSTPLANNPSEVDLFADANFVSAKPDLEAVKSSAPQTNIDLFASQPAPAVSTTVDFFAEPDPVFDNKAAKSDTVSNNAVDPFAAFPMNSFGGSNELTSHTDPLSAVSDKHSHNDTSHGKIKESSVETKSPQKKDPFQSVSGIWADSFSRGLIDLNISAPKKVNLADVGIVGGLTDGSEEKEKGPPPPLQMGKAMGVGKSGSTPTPPLIDDDFFSSLSGQQSWYGDSKK
ncbi:hypothetical protein ABFS83_05G138400 [Erythranthe nasuta]